METEVGKITGNPATSNATQVAFQARVGGLPEETQTRSIPAENPGTTASTTGKRFEGDTVFRLHSSAGTVRGWRRPMVNTQIVPTTAVAAIGIMARGKLPVSAWI
jgi:hypothetical protein